MAAFRGRTQGGEGRGYVSVDSRIFRRSPVYIVQCGCISERGEEKKRNVQVHAFTRDDHVPAVFQRSEPGRDGFPCLAAHDDYILFAGI